MILPPVVGFCGRAGAGKSTAAAFLVAAHGYERVRFAGPLKAMLRALGLTEAEVDGADKERPSALLGGKTPRQAMQWLGTEWGRDLIDPDLWMRAWALAADAILDRGGRVVIDDVRFVNEAAAIRARGGIVLNIASAGGAPAPRHVSETIAFEWDARVENDGVDLEAFRASLTVVIAQGVSNAVSNARELVALSL